MPLPALLIPALANLAPGLIRAAGNLLGGKANDAADIVAKVVESGGDLESAVNQMPPEVVIELERIAIEAKKLDNERLARGLQHEETLSGQIQATAQAEQQYGNDVSKTVRPETARESFRTGGVFAFALLIAEACREGLGFNEYTIFILGLILSPCLAYFGVRSFDKWKGQLGTVA